MKVRVKVIPRAKKNSIEKLLDNELKVHLTATPADGKANDLLIKLLSKYFKCSKSKIKIIKGKKSREKIVEILNEKV